MKEEELLKARRIYLAALRGLKKQAADDRSSENYLVSKAAVKELREVNIKLHWIDMKELPRPYE